MKDRVELWDENTCVFRPCAIRVYPCVTSVFEEFIDGSSSGAWDLVVSIFIRWINCSYMSCSRVVVYVGWGILSRVSVPNYWNHLSKSIRFNLLIRDQSFVHSLKGHGRYSAIQPCYQARFTARKISCYYTTVGVLVHEKHCVTTLLQEYYCTFTVVPPRKIRQPTGFNLISRFDPHHLISTTPIWNLH